MLEAIRSTETSVLTRATGRNIPEDDIFQSSPWKPQTTPQVTHDCFAYRPSYNDVSIRKRKQTTRKRGQQTQAIARRYQKQNINRWKQSVSLTWYVCMAIYVAARFSKIINYNLSIFTTTLNCSVRLQIFRAVTMKNAVFWDKKPSSYLTGDTLPLPYRVQPVNAM
jgi:hypothetical protein